MHLHFREMSLDELLNDPLVQLLMASDGVEDAALRHFIETIRRARRMNGRSTRRLPSSWRRRLF